MRKRTLGLALSAILAPSMSYAVGLGEISTYSALNQPLNAQIEMVSATPDEVGDVTVKLAPESVFEQVGINRSPVLNHLRFKPAVVNGVPVIKVFSDTPIQEPFVNFIVEVSWPKGKLLREYTVLLDPPVLGGGAPAAPATAGATGEIADVPIFTAEPEPDLGATPAFSEEVASELETYPIESTVEPVAEAIEPVETLTEPEFQPVELAEPEAPSAVAPEGIDNWLPPFVQGALDTAQADIETYPVAEPVAEEEPVFEPVAEEVISSPVEAVGDTYEVRRGDTLFSIAKRARAGSAANVHQMMVAIQRNNPSAFARNDMNRLKAGYILRLPDPDEAAQISRAEAKAAVMAAIGAQGGAFQKLKNQAAKTAVPQAVADSGAEAAGLSDLESRVKESAAVEVAKAEEAAKPELEILAPEGKGNNAAGDEGGEGSAAETSAALVKEKLESTKQESEELSSRLNELESMISDKDRLIELKDEKLAELQTGVSGEEPAPQPAVTESGESEQEAAKAGAEETGEPTTIGDLLEKPGDEVSATETDTGLTESEKAAEPVEEAQDTEGQAEGEGTAQAEATGTQSETDKEAESAGSAEIDNQASEEEVVAADESTGLVDKLKDNPTALAGVGAGALLLSGLAWLIFRRKEEEPEVIDEYGEELVDDAQPVEPEAAEGTVSEVEDELSHTTEISADEVMLEPAEPAVVAVEEESEEPGTLVGIDSGLESGEWPEDEVLSEANVYLAYGLHDQAVDLLKPAVEAHPERNDYIAKLAEAYHALGDKEAFIETAQKMQGPADSEENKKLFQRVAVMGKDIAPEHEMFANADTGDLTLTAITNRPDALTETGISDEDVETMSIDAEGLDLTPDDTQLPDLDELSKSLQMEESEALKELRDAAAEELEDVADDATNLQIEAPDLEALQDEKLDDIKEGLAGITSAADESVAELDTRTLTMAMGELDDADLSLDELEDDFNSLTTGTDEISTKLDLAKAYIDMGDDEGAREALEEVIAQGNPEQQSAARKLLEQLK